MNKICYLFGHKTGDLNDSGYPVCEICNSHSYYDDWNKSGYLFKPYNYLRFKWIKFRIWYRLKYFNELPF
jgi:hypothetical protein